MSVIALIDKKITALQSQSHTITIHNWWPAKINEWQNKHWSVRSALKKRDREMIGFYAYSYHIPLAKGKRSVQLTIQLGYKERGGDPDSMFKSLLDALVHAKLLTDDNKEGVELLPVKYLKNTMGKLGIKATIITLTEMSA